MADISIRSVRALALVPACVIGVLLAQAVAVPTSNAHAALDPVHHGAELFAQTGCAHCHGAAGSGGDRGPDLKDIRRRMTAKAMATQIHDGGQSMPPFGETLKEQEIADVVAYLRAKKKPLPPASAASPQQ